MKIALLSIHNGLIQRGAEVFVEKISQEFAKKNDVTVFQMGDKNANGYNRVIISGVLYFQHQGRYQNWLRGKISEFLYTVTVLLFTLKCFPMLLTGGYDWIIPINGGLQSVLTRLVRLFRPNTKILIIGHAGVGRDDRWNLLIGDPDVFVALTPRAYSWAKNISPSKKIVHIPNGIDLKNFSPNGNIMSFPCENPIILCVAALVSYKRIDLLIRAVSLLQKGSLVIVGEGPLQKTIESIGKNILGLRFHLIHDIPHDEMPSVYRAAKVFSLPSDVSEAFGLSYLEALACNIPVVAPDDRNRREIIDGSGIFVHPEKISEYAKGLQEALEKDFGNKPRNQAKNFSWETIAKRYEELFKD